jgi:hypothetical protein
MQNTVFVEFVIYIYISNVQAFDVFCSISFVITYVKHLHDRNIFTKMGFKNIFENKFDIQYCVRSYQSTTLTL